MSLSKRREMVDPDHKSLSKSAQCMLLSLPRSSYYYQPKGISSQDLRIMELMDRMYQEDPTRGSRRYQRDLRLADKIGRASCRESGGHAVDEGGGAEWSMSE